MSEFEKGYRDALMGKRCKRVRGAYKRGYFEGMLACV